MAQDLHNPQQTTSQMHPHSWSISSDAKQQMTTGEKWFHRITYTGLAEGATFVSSVVFAYLAKFSRIKFPGSNDSWSEKWQQWGEKVGEKTLMTTALMMGGNLFIIPIRAMEAHKREIVHFFNEKFGKEGEVEKGDQQVQNEPPQSWGSLLKGRVLAWLTVFTTLTAASKFIGPQMGKFEEKTGDLFVKAGKAVKPDLGERQEFRLRKAGELSAIDLFATLAASAIMQASSKVFARNSQGKKEQDVPQTDQVTAPSAAAEPKENPSVTTNRRNPHAQNNGGHAPRDEDSPAASPSSDKAEDRASYAGHARNDNGHEAKEWGSQHKPQPHSTKPHETYLQDHQTIKERREQPNYSAV